MTGSARDRARSLELIIRAAVAEERLLGARLARMEESQRQTRENIARVGLLGYRPRNPTRLSG
jgi:ABC-type proline/glycine betaine transport system ATPase subunit